MRHRCGRCGGWAWVSGSVHELLQAAGGVDDPERTVAGVGQFARRVHDPVQQDRQRDIAGESLVGAQQSAESALGRQHVLGTFDELLEQLIQLELRAARQSGSEDALCRTVLTLIARRHIPYLIGAHCATVGSVHNIEDLNQAATPGGGCRRRPTDVQQDMRVHGGFLTRVTRVTCGVLACRWLGVGS